jgi:hypothetical protein
VGSVGRSSPPTTVGRAACRFLIRAMSMVVGVVIAAADLAPLTARADKAPEGPIGIFYGRLLFSWDVHDENSGTYYTQEGRAAYDWKETYRVDMMAGIQWADPPFYLGTRLQYEHGKGTGRVLQIFSEPWFSTFYYRENYHIVRTPRDNGDPALANQPEWEDITATYRRGPARFGKGVNQSRCSARLVGEWLDIACQLTGIILSLQRSNSRTGAEPPIETQLEFVFPGNPRDGPAGLTRFRGRWRNYNDHPFILLEEGYSEKTVGQWQTSYAKDVASQMSRLAVPEGLPPQMKNLPPEIQEQIHKGFAAAREAARGTQGQQAGRQKRRGKDVFGRGGPFEGTMAVEADILFSSVWADAGGPYTVVRGETLQLDASKSKGDDLEYSWTFVPRCADGSAGTGSGVRPSVTFVCDTDITLEVTNGTATDRATTRAFVWLPSGPPGPKDP